MCESVHHQHPSFHTSFDASGSVNASDESLLFHSRKSKSQEASPHPLITLPILENPFTKKDPHSLRWEEEK